MLLTFKLILMTIVVMDAPAFVAPLRRVLCIHRLHRHASLFWVVFNELLEFAEWLLWVPVSVREAISNLIKRLEDDAVAVTLVLKCFLDDSVFDRVKDMLDVLVFSNTHFLKRGCADCVPQS